MNTDNGFCGAYCYYDLQTALARNLGNAFLNTAPLWLPLIEDGSGRGGEWIPPEWRGKSKKEESQDNVDENFLKVTNLDKIPVPSGDRSKLITAGILAIVYLYITNTISTTIPNYKMETTTYNNTTNITKLIIERSP